MRLDEKLLKQSKLYFIPKSGYSLAVTNLLSSADKIPEPTKNSLKFILTDSLPSDFFKTINVEELTCLLKYGRDNFSSIISRSRKALSSDEISRALKESSIFNWIILYYWGENKIKFSEDYKGCILKIHKKIPTDYLSSLIRSLDDNDDKFFMKLYKQESRVTIKSILARKVPKELILYDISTESKTLSKAIKEAFND